MGFFSKLFQGPQVDMEKSRANAQKMRALFNQVVENGDQYRLIFGYTEDVARFNYGFVHGSKTKIGNLIVGWNEASQTIVVVPTVPSVIEEQYNYVFDAWDPEVPANVTGNATYTALYKAEKARFTVRFVDGDGKIMSEAEYGYGDLVSAPEATDRKSVV